MFRYFSILPNNLFSSASKGTRSEDKFNAVLATTAAKKSPLQIE